jgi:hypothetical protein
MTKKKARPDWGDDDWRPRATAGASLREDELHLLSLFGELSRRYGMRRARKMFANFAREPNKTEWEELAKLETLWRLDNMNPRPNIKRLVRELLAEKGIAAEDRRFPNQAVALDKKIRRWKKDRVAIEAKFGAVSPPLMRGEPAKFVIVEKRTSRKGQMS